MKQIFVATILIFLFVGCANIKINIDTKKDFDFTSWSKFNIVYVKKGDVNDFFRNRVEMLLGDYFMSKGYTSSDKEIADFSIQFQYSIETKTTEIQETKTQRPIIYLRGMRNIPLNLSGTCNSSDLKKLMLSRLALEEYIKPIDTIVSISTYEYQSVKLFIELVDVKTKKVIWQGLVKGDLSDISTHIEIEQIINKLFNDFPRK